MHTFLPFRLECVLRIRRRSRAMAPAREKTFKKLISNIYHLQSCHRITTVEADSRLLRIKGNSKKAHGKDRIIEEAPQRAQANLKTHWKLGLIESCAYSGVVIDVSNILEFLWQMLVRYVVWCIGWHNTRLNIDDNKVLHFTAALP